MNTMRSTTVAMLEQYMNGVMPQGLWYNYGIGVVSLAN